MVVLHAVAHIFHICSYKLGIQLKLND